MKYLLLLGILLAIGMCSEDEDLQVNDQTVYFQFEYVNHAWGLNHNGFIIDEDGNLYEYDKPEGWKWAEDGKISKADFEANLAKTTKSSSDISDAKLEEMKSLALKVKFGSMTDMKSVMADAGAEVYAVYTADKSDSELTYQLLQMRGDNYQKNKSSAADKITEWLIGIRGEDGFSNEHF